MKHLALLLTLTVTPAFAQETPPVPDTEAGVSLMQEGAKLLFKGLMAELEPSMDEMAKSLSAMEPMLKDLPPKLMELMTLMGDVQNYHGPEKLPNGDILIRRKTAEELKLEALPAPATPEIDL